MEGIDRIKALAAEVKDNALLKIVEYLITREDMNDKYLNEEKTLKQMVDFIRLQAQQQAKDGMAMIQDEVVYGWAIHYFDESNEKLKLLSKVEKTSIKSEDTKKDKVEKKDKSQRWVAEGQLTLF